mgnify:CR=1|tara:strand:+ start:886 stop:2148 length:1263 start_codon:yes stop_codon:yes gene_type:complete
MHPSYIAGQQFGNRVGAAMTNIDKEKTKLQDKSALDEILENASKSNDPNAITDVMGQLLSRVNDPQKKAEAYNILKFKYEGLVEQKKQQRTEQNAKQNISALGQARNVDVSGFTDPKLAEQATRQKNLPGGVSNLPVTDEEASATERVINENPNVNADQLAIAFAKAKIPPRLSNPYIENRRRQDESESKFNLDKATRKSKFGEEIAKPILLKADEASAAIPQKRTALNLMKESILSGDLSFFSPDSIADITGFEVLRTPSGALFKTGGKEYFLGNISRAGARPNQWIEQQIQEMLPRIGRDAASNLSVTRALENELDLDDARVRFTKEISNEIEESDGNWRTLGEKLNEKLSDYASERQSVLFNDLRAIKAVDEGKPQKFMKVKQGTPVTKLVVEAFRQMFPNDMEKAIEEAKKLGYEN